MLDKTQGMVVIGCFVLGTSVTHHRNSLFSKEALDKLLWRWLNVWFFLQMYGKIFPEPWNFCWEICPLCFKFCFFVVFFNNW